MPYDLKTIKAPRLAGRALQAVAVAVESPIVGPLLVRKLAKDVGFDDFRAAELSEVPSVLPDLPRPATAAAPPGESVDAFKLVEGVTRPPGDFGHETIADYVRAYREGRSTPDKVARNLLEALRRADGMSPPLRAMIAVREEDVRAQAAASAERWRAGKPLSPLDGVPVAVKDEVDLAGYPTTIGTSFLRAVAAEDCAAAARLRAAGALLFGKANMVEIGIDVLGFNAHHGTPRNPYAGELRYSGGSSSGPGVAVSSGLGPVALGADGGGSIRIPAAICGVAGLKATHGRISEQGVYPLCWSVGHVGPIGATVRDVTLAYAIMAGPVVGDALSQLQPAPTLAGITQGGVDGLRVGVFRDWFEDAAPAIVAACRAALDGLVARGARLVDVDIPDLDLCRLAHAVTIIAEMALTMDRHLAHLGELGAAVRINLAIARSLTARDYVQAQRARTRISGHFARVFEACDVLATPATAVTAPRVRPDVFARGESDLETSSALMRFALPMNLTGHPALSVPAGYDGDGLPIGLQLVGRPWEEHVLLRAGEVVESIVSRRRPLVHFPLLS